MGAKDWFTLALRIVGVVLLLYGLRDLVDHLLYQLGYFNWPDVSPRYFVAVGAIQICAGLYLVRGAPLLVGFAFPGAAEGVEDEAQDAEAGPKSGRRMYEDAVRVLFHMNGCSKVMVERTGTEVDVPTEAIPLHLRAIGSRFILLFPTDPEEMAAGFQVRPLPDDEA